MNISTCFGAILLASLCFLSAAAPAPLVFAAAPPGVGEEASREGAEALAEARAAKLAAYELEAGEARSVALLAAAQAYSQVSETERFALDARVEAAFRAGELLRTHGSADLAGKAFARCVQLGEPADAEQSPALREFAARGLLEQAHMQRRGKQLVEAAAGYADAARRFPELGVRAAQARGWQLRMLIELEQLEAAKAVGERVLETLDDDPLESLRGIDRLAVALVDANQVPAARLLVERLKAALQPHIDEDGRVSERLKTAVQELRVTVRLSDS